MKLKNRAAVFNDYPSLMIHPLLCVISMLLFIWLFPYVAIIKLLISESASFMSGAVKVGIAVLVFYLGFQYVVAFFRASLVTAAVLRIRGKSYSILDGFIEVLRAAGYFLVWVPFDIVVFPLWELAMKTLQKMPAQLDGDVAELAAWKIRDFAVPVMVFEKLMPHRAVEKASDMVIRKGVAALLRDIGWGVLGIALFCLGIAFPLLLKLLPGEPVIESYWVAIWLSYFAFIWIFSIVNSAIGVAQIYALD